ncbi:MAG: VacJ family lipoprotein [Desulfovibrionaceae bacterium]
MYHRLPLCAALAVTCALWAATALAQPASPDAAPGFDVAPSPYDDPSYDTLRGALHRSGLLVSAAPMAPMGNEPADAFDDGFGGNGYGETGPAVADPLEKWNRFWFQFNDSFYFYVTKPLARVYNVVAPEPVRVGVKNVFHNLLAPVRFVSLLLQGKFMGAGVEFQSFLLNTTFGFGGLVNQAEHYKTVVPVHDEDLGQTLATWGVGNGCYIVWPFLGPSTLRDTVGMVGDSFLDPVSYITPFGHDFVSENPPFEETLPLKGYRSFNTLSLHIGDYEAMKKAAIDPYTSMRNAYIQYRNKEVAR